MRIVCPLLLAGVSLGWSLLELVCHEGAVSLAGLYLWYVHPEGGLLELVCHVGAVS